MYRSADYCSLLQSCAGSMHVASLELPNVVSKCTVIIFYLLSRTELVYKFSAYKECNEFIVVHTKSLRIHIILLECWQHIISNIPIISFVCVEGGLYISK